MNLANTIEIPQDMLDSARLTIPELKVEMALFLYAQGRISFGKAREFANKTHWEFRHILAAHRIAPHYDVIELEEDVHTLLQAGRL